MEYSVTNMFAEKMTENVYVKAFAKGAEVEQREIPPLVSVLMASYNHEKYVEAAVRSVMGHKPHRHSRAHRRLSGRTLSPRQRSSRFCRG